MHNQNIANQQNQEDTAYIAEPIAHISPEWISEDRQKGTDREQPADLRLAEAFLVQEDREIAAEDGESSIQ